MSSAGEALLTLTARHEKEDSAEDFDSARLVASFQAGEREAFAELYQRYVDRVYSYLRIVLRGADDAEDATQQVFVQALDALPRYEQRAQPFRAWLFVIAKNTAIKQLRREGKLEPEDPAEVGRLRDRGADGEAPLFALSWISDGELVLFIERLPLPQRQVLVMRLILDLSVPQVAQILGRKPSEISLLHHRALAFLRKRLIAVGRDPQTGEVTRWRRRRDQSLVLRSRRFVLFE